MVNIEELNQNLYINNVALHGNDNKFLDTITNQIEELAGQTVLDVANSAKTETIATPA